MRARVPALTNLKAGAAASLDDDAEAGFVDILKSLDARIGDDDVRHSFGGRRRRGQQRFIQQLRRSLFIVGFAGVGVVFLRR